MINPRYTKEQYFAADAQRIAHEIAFGPVTFQVSRLMVKFGIFSILADQKEGLALEQIAQKTKLSNYAAQVLLESSLTIGSVILKENKYLITKLGWFLVNDEMVRVNMNFNHDVNYKGMFHLEEALLNGKPEGLKVLGDWETIYQGLSSLDADVQKSWFDFDHFYSDNSFKQALNIVFAEPVSKLMDIGGNTGKWALNCVDFAKDVEVTIVDLPQQIEMMKHNTSSNQNASRIHGVGLNLLQKDTKLPEGHDVIWMSQFLDCFSASDVMRILKKVREALSESGRIFIMETLWDRQKYPAASFDLAQISLYFTAMANGNSKMFYSEDLFDYIREAGLEVVKLTDNLGLGHTLLECKLKK
ncbi:methyltransferase [Bacteroides propionicifaciens]|uniref:methyltransferase n=1 Tax=Bacteroides propionicifaciens TaxID=392838 RepID=UPI0003711FEB|nr:methyltransferase [Bacteroides propionicifaciens]